MVNSGKSQGGFKCVRTKLGAGTTIEEWGGEENASVYTKYICMKICMFV